MKPVKFKASNFTFLKPENMTEECGSLDVFRDENLSISCWEPSEEEIKQILEHKKIWLGIVGQGHPPVFLTGIKPIEVIYEENRLKVKEN